MLFILLNLILLLSFPPSIVRKNHVISFQNVKNILLKKKIRQEEAVRLVMLYALKYYEHPSNDLNGLINQLVSDYDANQSHIRVCCHSKSSFLFISDSKINSYLVQYILENVHSVITFKLYS